MTSKELIIIGQHLEDILTSIGPNNHQYIRSKEQALDIQLDLGKILQKVDSLIGETARGEALKK